MILIDLSPEEKQLISKNHLQQTTEEENEKMPWDLQLLWMKIHKPEEWLRLSTI